MQDEQIFFVFSWSRVFRHKAHVRSSLLDGTFDEFVWNLYLKNFKSLKIFQITKVSKKLTLHVNSSQIQMIKLDDSKCNVMETLKLIYFSYNEVERDS
jgi:hypothetical protein